MKDNKINLELYKVINIYTSSLYNPITPFELFVNKNYILTREEFPEECKHFKKISNISEAISFLCQVFNYSLISVTLNSNGYYTIAFKKDLK